MAVCRDMALHEEEDNPHLKNRDTCVINVKQLHPAHALIINPLNHSEFLYPDSNGNIEFKSGKPVFLSCADSLNKFESISYIRHETFLCVCDNMFWAKGEMYNFEDLRCQHIPRYKVLDKCEIKNAPVTEYGMKYHKFEIGFYTDDDQNFLKTMEIVTSDDNATIVYTKSKISKSLAGGQALSMKIPFNPSHYYNRRNVKVDDLYDINMQMNSFQNQLSSQNELPANKRYVRIDGGYSLIPGQLTSPSSMIYTAAAASTFAYLNTVPLWQKVKQGNWIRIENHVNEMAKALGRDLTVISGVTYSLNLVDSTSTQDDTEFVRKHLKKMFLYTARPNKESYIREYPIPSNLFKIVLDERRNYGVVFVTSNNPHAIPATTDSLCQSQMIGMGGELMPKDWEPMNPELGYSYICEVQDFLETVKIPFLDHITAREILYLPDVNKALLTLAPTSTSPTPPQTSTTEMSFLSKLEEYLSYKKDTIYDVYFEGMRW